MRNGITVFILKSNMKKEELIELSESILADLELGRCPLSSVVYKCLRLSRLMGDKTGMKMFECEAIGYQRNSKGYILSDQWELAYTNCGRGYQEKDDSGKYVKLVFSETILELEELVEAQKIRLQSSNDPDVSISSANPYQHVPVPAGNRVERNNAVVSIKEASGKLGKIKGAVYKYILNINYKLKYEDTFASIFDRNREIVFEKLQNICPDVLKEFDSIYNGLQSENEVDVTNCVHTCRTILKTVADYLYPPSKEKIKIGEDELVVTDDKYINRLLAFIYSKSESTTYKKVVGNSLEDINNKLHAIYDASCKGSHVNVSRFEAERFVIYTYLFLGDLMSLVD